MESDQGAVDERNASRASIAQPFTFQQLDLMDFTLAQLSNENLALLFNNAFYQAEELTSTNEDGEEESFATTVHLNDWNHIVYASPDDYCLSFETRITGIDTEMDQMLKICNFFDRFPVHANAFKDQELVLRSTRDRVVADSLPSIIHATCSLTRYQFA